MNYYQPMYQPMFPQYYYPNQVPQMNNQMNQSVNQNMQSNQTEPVIQRTNELIPVSSKDIAKNYPVAPGNSVTFKDENEPYIYIKTMGFSQFDKPKFEVLKLVKEDNEVESNEQTEVKEEKPEIDMSVFDNKFENINESIQVLDDEMKETKTDIDWLKNRVDELSKRRNKATTVVKKVGESDE